MGAFLVEESPLFLIDFFFWLDETKENDSFYFLDFEIDLTKMIWCSFFVTY